MSDNKQVDLQHIYGIAGGEEEFVIEIIHNFLDTSVTRLDKLLADLKSNRSEDLHFDSHKLKGTFRFIGATGLGNIMEDLEKKSAQGMEIENVDKVISEVRERYVTVVGELKEILQTLNKPK